MALEKSNNQNVSDLMKGNGLIYLSTGVIQSILRCEQIDLFANLQMRSIDF